MNIDICKKCKSQQELYVDIHKSLNDTIIVVEISILSEHHYNLYKTICEFYFNATNDYDDYEFINIKPNKSCPYYMEHLMSEWNKEKNEY